MIYPDLFTRLVANTEDPESNTGCWEWTGNTNNAGYGRYTVYVGGGKVEKRFGHRAMEEVMRGDNEFDLDDDPFGPILVVPRPSLGYDETIDHLCCFRRCINPDHWIGTVSRSENTKLMHQRKGT